MDSLPANTLLPFKCTALPYVASRCGVFSESQQASLCPLHSCLAPACIPLCVAEGGACERRYPLAQMLCCLFVFLASSLLPHILRNPKRRKFYLLPEWSFRFQIQSFCVKWRRVSFWGIVLPHPIALVTCIVIGEDFRVPRPLLGLVGLLHTM